MCTHTYSHACTHTLIHTHACARIHTSSTHTYMVHTPLSCIYARVHTHTRTHTHTHTNKHNLPSKFVPNKVRDGTIKTASWRFIPEWVSQPTNFSARLCMIVASYCAIIYLMFEWWAWNYRPAHLWAKNHNYYCIILNLSRYDRSIKVSQFWPNFLHQRWNQLHQKPCHY